MVLTWAFSVEVGGREACVDELYLVPEARNRGFGSRVLALLDDEARALGVRRVFLEVERKNRAIGSVPPRRLRRPWPLPHVEVP